MRDKQNIQDLVERLFDAGDAWIETSAAAPDIQPYVPNTSTRPVQGEAMLLERLNIDDSPQVRYALRNGVGGGAAAGALALLLTKRSGRRLAALGGLTGLAMLAFNAYHKNADKMPTWKDGVSGFIGGPKAETRASSLLRAMVSAAKADNKIDADEFEALRAATPHSQPTLKSILDQKSNPLLIARLADSNQAAREIYAVSCHVLDGESEKERSYLTALARALSLEPDLAARIETDVRIR